MFELPQGCWSKKTLPIDFVDGACQLANRHASKTAGPVQALAESHIDGFCGETRQLSKKESQQAPSGCLLCIHIGTDTTRNRNQICRNCVPEFQMCFSLPLLCFWKQTTYTKEEQTENLNQILLRQWAGCMQLSMTVSSCETSFTSADRSSRNTYECPRSLAAQQVSPPVATTALAQTVI